MIEQAPHTAHLADALRLPDLPGYLLEAERNHAAISTELKNARADFDVLNRNFSGMEVRRVDGSLFALSGRDIALADLQRRINELEAAEHAARRALSDARRKFSEEASAKLREPIDTLSSIVAERVAEVEAMLEMLDELAKHARRIGVGIQHGVVSRAPNIVRQLESTRRQLATVRSNAA